VLDGIDLHGEVGDELSNRLDLIDVRGRVG
jgi:hypothetical protein